jgi:16S rRNA (guanine966-N2)-methyltransferase
VLDLYAGSGALGLEALSRGAAECLLVESDARAARVLHANVAALGLPGARVVVDTVERALATAPAAPYDVVLADPPYDTRAQRVAQVLLALLEGGWADAGTVAAVERPTRGAPLTWPAGWEPARERKYGEATLWYGRPAS